MRAFRKAPAAADGDAGDRHMNEIRVAYRESQIDESADGGFYIVDCTQATRHVRAMFISDVHLGSRACKAEQLLDFLRHHEADTIYLVGDIVDGWQLRSSWYWPQAHNDVIQKLLRKARQGSRLIYIPGNHDEFLRGYFGTHFDGVVVTDHATHTAADGKRYVVTHGDQFDRRIRRARRFAAFGDNLRMLLEAGNSVVNFVRRQLNLPTWSLSNWARYKVKDVLNYVRTFEEALAAEAARRQTEGVICGHVHHASIRDFPSARYVNCGDWIESCSAAVEHFDGRLEIVSWNLDIRPQVSEVEVGAVRAA
jgi:UDP-2,3-diacylglucosamine pyrophosphatase LpxH